MRKLREDGASVAVQEKTESTIEKYTPEYKQEDGFDMATLDTMLPYHEGEALPSATIKRNNKGIHYLAKPGEPRFYFHENSLLKVYRGLGGKKTQLYWTYKGDAKSAIKSNMSNDIRPLHKRIRAYLKKRGIPGA